MSLINPALIYGLLLVIVPVLIHYLLRSQPKKLIFPAMRLLQNKQRRHQRRMQFKHLLLLLLRMGVIGLLVFALVRPSLPSADYGLKWWEWGLLGCLGVAGVVVYQLMSRRQGSASGKSDQQEMRLRSGILGGLLLLSALLVGWPWGSRVWAEMKSPVQSGNVKLPVAAVLLFDTSASMDYRNENRSRLQVAKEMAEGLLEEFPGGSKVAIADSMDDGEIQFQNDLSAGFKKLGSDNFLKSSALSVALNGRIKAAIRLQDESRAELMAESASLSDQAGEKELGRDRFLRDVYVFSDLAGSGWNRESSGELTQELEDRPWLNLYLIDVGVSLPINHAIRRIESSQSRAVVGQPLTLTVDVASAAAGETMMVEMYVRNELGDVSKQDFKQVTTEGDGSGLAQVAFGYVPRAEGLIQGEFRITGSDPLSIDDTRYFSLASMSKAKVLLISDDARAAFELSQALAPEGLENSGASRYEVTMVTPANVTSAMLASMSAAFLINVSEPSDSLWETLRNYVKSGGGLVTVLGSTKIDPVDYRGDVASELLPALPEAHSRFRDMTFVDVAGSGHVLAGELNALGVGKLLTLYEVRRYWKTELRPGSAVVAEYSDREHTLAMGEKSLGRGLSILLTTGVDLEGGAYRQNWSDLARAGWGYVALADLLVVRVAGLREAGRNYELGQTVDLELTAEKGESFLLRQPNLKQSTVTLPYQGPLCLLRPQRGSEALTASKVDGVAAGVDLAGATEIGHYQLLPEVSGKASRLALEGPVVQDGFSVNVRGLETDLTPISAAELDLILGTDQYQVARGLEDLERRMLKTRLGEEIYPLLVTLMLVVFVSEHLVANFFYQVKSGY